MKKIYLLRFLFCLLVSGYTFGQNAESLFKEYWKIGLRGQQSYYQSFNEPNPANLFFNSIRVYALGGDWNFKQWGNNNLKLTILKPFAYTERDTFNFLASEGELGLDFDTGLITELLTSNSQWKFGLGYERFVPVGKVFFSVGAGIEVLNFPEYRGRTLIGLGSDEEGETIQRIAVNRERVRDWTLGLKGEVNFYWPTNIGLFRFGGEGYVAGNNLQEFDVRVFNLEVSPDYQGQAGHRGHYIGFGFSYFPKRKRKKE